jgi:hypothetical protein
MSENWSLRLDTSVLAGALSTPIAKLLDCGGHVARRAHHSRQEGSTRRGLGQAGPGCSWPTICGGTPSRHHASPTRSPSAGKCCRSNVDSRCSTSAADCRDWVGGDSVKTGTQAAPHMRAMGLLSHETTQTLKHTHGLVGWGVMLPRLLKDDNAARHGLIGVVGGTAATLQLMAHRGHPTG